PDNLLSDGHSLLSVSLAVSSLLKTNNTINEPESQHNLKTCPKWQTDKKEMFCNQINQEHMAVLIQMIESMNFQTGKNELNVVVDEIKCHKTRCTYNLAKSKYKGSRSLRNKLSLRNARNAHKSTMNKFISKHKEITARKLCNLKTHKPKEYW
ncbi:hypothetical protein MAR_025688, partial [Mya arenaria]